jgi:hypothetical protein
MWQKGQSGNPLGRRVELTSARRLLDSRAPELIQKAIDMALVDHDSAALKICIDRIMPVRRRSGVIQHPEVEAQLAAGADLEAIGRAVIQVVARGELDPDDGFAVLEMLESQKRLASKPDRPEAAPDGDPAAALRDLADQLGFTVTPKTNGSAQVPVNGSGNGAAGS